MLVGWRVVLVLLCFGVFFLSLCGLYRFSSLLRAVIAGVGHVGCSDSLGGGFACLTGCDVWVLLAGWSRSCCFGSLADCDIPVWSVYVGILRGIG